MAFELSSSHAVRFVERKPSSSRRVVAGARMRRRARTWVRAPSPCEWCRSCPRSEEHTSELQSLMRNSYAVFCLNKKTKQHAPHRTREVYGSSHNNDAHH